MGQLAKTDKIDARVLALFAERVRPEVRELPDDAARLLTALLTRRRRITDMIVAESNRQGFAPPFAEEEHREAHSLAAS